MKYGRKPGPAKKIKSPSLLDRLSFFERLITSDRGVTDHDKGLDRVDKQS